MVEEESQNNIQNVNKVSEITIHNLLGTDNIKSDSLLVEKTNDEFIQVDFSIDYKKWIKPEDVNKLYEYLSQENIKSILRIEDIRDTPKTISIYQHDIESLKYVFANSDESTIISFMHLFMHKYKITNYTDFIVLMQEMKTPFCCVPVQKFFYSSQFEQIVDKVFLCANNKVESERQDIYKVVTQMYENFEINDKFVNINNWYTSKHLDPNSYFVRLYPPFFYKYYKEYSSIDHFQSKSLCNIVANTFIMKCILIYHAVRFYTQDTDNIETLERELLAKIVGHQDTNAQDAQDAQNEDVLFFQQPIIMFYILCKMFTIGFNVDKSAMTIPIESFFESKTNCIYPILYGKEDKSRNNFLNNITKYGLEDKVALLNMTLQSYYNSYVSKRPVKLEILVEKRFSNDHGQFHVIDTVTNTIISHLLIEIKSDQKSIELNQGKPLIEIV